MKGFYIEITNNLLDPKHQKQMKESVWLFMWCLDKITSISEEGIGTVLRGKPITHQEVKKELDLSRRTYTDWVARLKKYKYINTTRAPRGLIFEVNKAQKRFGQKSKRWAENRSSSDEQKKDSDEQKKDSDEQKNAHPLYRQDNNKTIQDKAFDIFWKEYPKKVMKDIAKKSWKKLKVDEKLLKTILQDIKFRKTTVEWLKNNGMFIPYPTTYLNQRRWEDEDKGSEPEKKPYFGDDLMVKVHGQWKVIVKGEFKQYVGREDEIEYK